MFLFKTKFGRQVVFVGCFCFAVLPFGLASGPALAKSDRHEKKQYEKTLWKWTRTSEVFQRDDFNASLKWYATPINEEIIAAQIRRVASVYQYDQPEYDNLSAKMTERFSHYTVYYVSFYSYEYRFEDLSKESNDWKIYLESNCNKTAPIKIEKINKVSQMDQMLFPYSNLWSHHYYIYFPKQSESTCPVKLSVFGPGGKDTLTW